MSVQMRQPLTSSRKKLDDSLSLVDTPAPKKDLMMQGDAGGTLL